MGTADLSCHERALQPGLNGGRDLSALIDRRPYWDINRYARCLAHGCIYINTDLTGSAGLAVVYQEILLAQISRSVWRYTVFTRSGNSLHGVGAHLCQLPDQQPDLCRAAFLCTESARSSKRSDAHLDRHTDDHANQYGNIHTNLYAQGHADVLANTDTHEYINSDSESHADTFSDEYTVANPNR